MIEFIFISCEIIFSFAFEDPVALKDCICLLFAQLKEERKGEHNFFESIELDKKRGKRVQK